jgi:phosphatidylglycerol:prolipoprotein diacylglycerol transferase
MVPYPDIKPYIVKIGPFQLRWYSLMYLIGFLCSYLLVKYQIKKKNLPIENAKVDDIYFYLFLGLLLGARLGYVLFYNFFEYLKNPIEILAVWHGGMSFHGGLIGVILAGVYITRKRNIAFWLFADLVIVTAPIGLGLGRIGNFINGELYGRVTDVPWAMVFPGGGALPRHPSQLYESFFEGVVLFIILWLLKDRIKTEGKITGLFLVLYGVIRFIIEFFREPDPQLGFIFAFFSMGQILSFLMIIAGIYIVKKRNGLKSG